MSAFDSTPLRPDVPAMPVHGGYGAPDDPRNQILGGGLTARQHAAIALRVPNSGTEWLDDMIRASLRDQFSRDALGALIGGRSWSEPKDQLIQIWAVAAFAIADAMLAERGAK